MARIPPPPSPIPTAKGGRSAADPILSEHIDRSVQIPELKLPQHVARSEPEEVSYELIAREADSSRRFFRSLREFGVVSISDHGIPSEELRFALANGDRIFGLTVECCTSYGDHDRIVWSGDDDQIAHEAAAAIGERNYQIFRQRMENAARKLEAIAKELSKVIGKQQEDEETIQFGGSKLSIYRYHRANVIDRNSSVIGETIQESRCGPYALSLHLFLEPTELCIHSDSGLLSFGTKANTLIVTTGKELEEWSLGEIKSAQGKVTFKPFLHTSRASFSLQQKWSVSKSRIAAPDSNRAISLLDQILILLVIVLICNSFSYVFS